jgi:hypothetical protein
MTMPYCGWTGGKPGSSQADFRAAHRVNSNIVMLLLHLCVTRSNDASWLWLCFVGVLKKF